MHRITVQYATPSDPVTFRQRYLDEHVTLVRELPGIQAFSVSWTTPMGEGPAIHLVAELDFADSAAADAALGSPAMGAAGEHAASLGAAMSMFRGDVLPQF